jgi:hypothetical protein
VLFGPPARPTDILFVLEEPGGQAYFRALDFSWPLNVPLDVVTVDHLPAPYNGRYRDRTFPVTILPVQEVTGEDHHASFERMLSELRIIRARGVAAPRQSA